MGDRWSDWYNLGVWAADATTVARHSVDGQGDADGDVATDTLVVARDRPAADMIQVRLRLFSEGDAIPRVIGVAVALSTRPTAESAGEPGSHERWNHVLEVPACSQMVYPDGGEVWCSPTSTSMVLAYWTASSNQCEPAVRAAVAGTYDWVYRGNGNWPFNTAYAATHGLEAFVARFTSLAEAETWLAHGVPLILSYGWRAGELDDAPVSSAGGHLGVLVGFDRLGNVVMNDPAAASDRGVRRTYNRAQFERIWLGRSGGTAYVAHPPGHGIPPHVLA
jgi:hypothetical protein